MGAIALPLGLMAASSTMSALGAKAAGSEADKRNTTRAEQIKWSPWTRKQAQGYSESPSVLGSAMSGGMSGLGAGLSLNNAISGPSALENAQTAWYNKLAGVGSNVANTVPSLTMPTYGSLLTPQGYSLLSGTPVEKAMAKSTSKPKVIVAPVNPVNMSYADPNAQYFPNQLGYNRS